VIKLIVGLGNPGEKFKLTRHNVGFMAIDKLKKEFLLSLRKRRFNSQYGEGKFNTHFITLMKPLTFINKSGEAVASFIKAGRISERETMIICDDVNLPLGKIRIRAKGSSGGHHGLESIIENLNSIFFPRLRIGIGKPSQGNLERYVLSNFTQRELLKIREVLHRVVEAIKVTLSQGLFQAMNIYNS
jgi:PTH1 family peptidyl-tRNA hydrolase